MREIAPGQTLDQYEITDVIARSGMATIFRARDVETGQPVVVKVPHIQFEADVVFNERFRREEEIGLKLDHPAIVKVLRPSEKSRVYLVQELVEGESLGARMRRDGPLPIDEAVRIAMQIADALEYMHRKGVVHRDLKPENVILTPDGGLKIMDFGIAYDATLRKITWSGLSQTTGTPDYMSPEQVEGQRGEPRSDLYALATMLYEMLTGKVPFPEGSAFAAMKAKVTRDPMPPRRLRPEISPGLEEVLLLALEREPSARPESAFEMREMLRHPESLKPSGRARRDPAVSRLSRRSRQAIALSVLAVLIVLLIGAVLSSRRTVAKRQAAGVTAR